MARLPWQVTIETRDITIAIAPTKIIGSCADTKYINRAQIQYVWEIKDSPSGLARCVPSGLARCVPSGLAPRALRALGPRALRALGPRALRALGPRTLRALGPRTLRALGPRSLRALGPRALRALGPRTLRALGPRALSPIHTYWAWLMYYIYSIICLTQLNLNKPRIGVCVYCRNLKELIYFEQKMKDTFTGSISKTRGHNISAQF